MPPPTALSAQGTSVTYEYNGDGLRTKKISNGKETNYLYDRQHVILETDINNRQKNRYIKGIKYIGVIGKTNKEIFYVYNSHGDVTLTITPTWKVLNQYDYDIFGNITLEIETHENAIKYSGEFYDNETGLYYLRARYYNPHTARFISEDSYWGEETNPLSLNLYTYCYNNPVKYVDPSGHQVTEMDRTNLGFVDLFLLGMYTEQYVNAKTKAEKDKAHSKAEKIRNKYRNANQVGNGKGDTVDKRTGEVVSGKVVYKHDPKISIKPSKPSKPKKSTSTTSTTSTKPTTKPASNSTNNSNVAPAVVSNDIGNSGSGSTYQRVNNNSNTDEEESYLSKSAEQLLLGNYTDEVTALGTGAQVVTSLVGLDLPADVRDITYDFTHWEWSWSHAGHTTLDALSFLPLVGVFKYTDEVASLAKNGDNVKSVDTIIQETSKAKNLWGKWSDYDKVTIEGRQYAKIGDKYYTRHAVDRMQPSGMRYTAKGSVDGGKVGASRIIYVESVDYGRSISPNYVEDVITNGKLIDTPVVNGVERQIWQSGTVEVVTEGDIIITIMTK